MRVTKIMKPICVACMFVIAVSAVADDGRPNLGDYGTPELFEAIRTLEDGWQPVSEGVWQRENPDGRVESYVTGVKGLSWAVAELESRLASWVDLYLIEQDESLQEILDIYVQQINELHARIAQAEKQPLSKAAELPAPTCSQYNLGLSAAAFPLSCGNRATASSFYNTNDSACPACSIYAYAFVSRTCNNTTNTQSQTCSDNGTNVSCSVAAQLTGAVSSCYSYGFASVSCPAPLSFYLSVWEDDTRCATGICLACPVTHEQ